ncbi:MAG: 4Fe-4S binding protein [Thermoanaerobacteraceae bacterium]|nr:4Fe-4S binding protein [Thermoanaerobacteraceae bacterium]
MEIKNMVVLETCRAAQGCPNSCFEMTEVVKQLKELTAKREINEQLRQKAPGKALYHHIFRVSVSGCPNSCSQPQIKDIGLQGQQVVAVQRDRCTACRGCIRVCPDKAIRISDGTAVIDRSRCLNCGICARACPAKAMVVEDTGFRVLVGGKLGRRPHLADEIYPLVKKEEVVPLVDSLLQIYLKEAHPGEKFAGLVNRLGLEYLRKREGELNAS